MQYKWVSTKDIRGTEHHLIPCDEPNPYSLRRIANIYRATDRAGRRYFVQAWQWNGKSGWAYLKSVVNAKRSVQNAITRKCWDVPEIENPA